ncbi:unnamed protein product, partial [Amoebophrya sp. A120]
GEVVLSFSASSIKEIVNRKQWLVSSQSCPVVLGRYRNRFSAESSKEREPTVVSETTRIADEVFASVDAELEAITAQLRKWGTTSKKSVSKSPAVGTPTSTAGTSRQQLRRDISATKVELEQREQAAAEVKSTENAGTKGSPELQPGGTAGSSSPPFLFYSDPTQVLLNTKGAPVLDDGLFASQAEWKTKQDLRLHPKTKNRIQFPPRDGRTPALIEHEIEKDLKTWPKDWVKEVPKKRKFVLKRSSSEQLLLSAASGTASRIEASTQHQSRGLESATAKRQYRKTSTGKSRTQKSATGLTRFHEVVQDWAKTLRSPVQPSTVKGVTRSRSVGALGSRGKTPVSCVDDDGDLQERSVQVQVKNEAAIKPETTSAVREQKEDHNSSSEDENDAADHENKREVKNNPRSLLYYTEENTTTNGNDGADDQETAQPPQDQLAQQLQNLQTSRPSLSPLFRQDSVAELVFQDQESTKPDKKLFKDDPTHNPHHTATERGDPKLHFATTSEIAYRQVRSSQEFQDLFLDLTQSWPEKSPQSRTREARTERILKRQSEKRPLKACLYDSGETSYTGKYPYRGGEGSDWQVREYNEALLAQKRPRELKLNNPAVGVVDDECRASRFQGKLYGVRRNSGVTSRSRSRSRSRSNSPAKQKSQKRVGSWERARQQGGQRERLASPLKSVHFYPEDAGSSLYEESVTDSQVFFDGGIIRPADAAEVDRPSTKKMPNRAGGTTYRPGSSASGGPAADHRDQQFIPRSSQHQNKASSSSSSSTAAAAPFQVPPGKVLVDQSVLKTIKQEVAGLQKSLSDTKAQIPQLQKLLQDEQAKVASLQRRKQTSTDLQRLEKVLADREQKIRELEIASLPVPMGPELQELCSELTKAREQNQGLREQEADWQNRVRELSGVIDEQRERLSKYDDLQRKWTQAARLDEQKMRELYGRIEELEAIVAGDVPRPQDFSTTANPGFEPLSSRVGQHP